MTYVFDTNVFSQIIRSYYPSSFPTLWRSLHKLLNQKRVTSVREVFNELSNYRQREVHNWAQAWIAVFSLPSFEEAMIVREIYSIPHFQASVERRKLFSGSPNADAFVIARAKALNGTVVTLEKPTQGGAKIPDICTYFCVSCVSLQEFMAKENWIFGGIST